MLLNCGVGEDSWESLELKINSVHPKGNQSWIFIGRTDAEAETPILWPPDEKNWLIVKDPDSGKDWRWEEKGMTEDEMVGWHHQFDGHEFEQAPGVGDGQGSLACCSPWGHNESDMTEWLNWTDIRWQMLTKLIVMIILQYIQILSDFTFTFHFHALEKDMATHSGLLARRIPGMGEPGGLLSMGSHRVRHDWCNLAAAAEKLSTLISFS